MKAAAEMAMGAQASAGPRPPPITFGFGRIVAATDFSPRAQRAVDHAVRLAQRLGARLTVLHVYPERPQAWESALTGLEVSDWEQGREARKEKLAEAVAKARRAYPAVDGLLRTADHFGREILAVAKELRADLVVLSTHGHAGWKRGLYGSHAEQILKRASCPILVVPWKERVAGVPTTG